MAECELPTSQIPNVVPIGTALGAYHTLPRGEKTDYDAREPALAQIDDRRLGSDDSQDSTEVYLIEAADIAKAAFVGVAARGRDGRDYLSARRYVLKAMSALWAYQEAQTETAGGSTPYAIAANTGATILQFRPRNS